MSTQFTPLLTEEYKRKLAHHRGEVVVTGERLAQVERFLLASPVLVFDYETTGTRYYDISRACGIAAAGLDAQRRLHTFYVPWGHKTGETQLPYKVCLAFQRRIFAQPNLKIGHNLKFDVHFGHRETGSQILGGYYDTMIAASLYDENRLIGLKERAASDLGERDAIALDKELDQFAKQLAKEQKLGIKAYLAKKGYSEIPIYLAGFYACYDVEFTYRLFEYYNSWGLMDHYGDLFTTEMGLLRSLISMEENGQLVDAEYLWTLSQQLAVHKDHLRGKIHHAVGREINPGSDHQLRKLLFEEWRLPVTARTKSDAPSVDRAALEPFGANYPVVLDILDFRDADKIQGTYCYGLLHQMDGDAYVHPNFKQTGTNTGRLSCTEPNFQNISGDSDVRALAHSGEKVEDGGVDPWSVKRAFVVPEGYTRYYLDYSQIELRVIAWFSQDPGMIQTFIEGGDIHSLTSNRVFGDADKAHRRRAKVINFGISYGMSALGFARNTGMSVEEGEKFLAIFEKEFPGISAFKINLYAQMAHNGGQFRNPFGRSRRIPRLLSQNRSDINRAQRQAIASLIQGTAAELTKASLARVFRLIESMGLGDGVKLTNTIHDEIQLDIVDHVQAKPIVSAIKELMEDFPLFHPIPIKVDVEASKTNWSEKKDFEL